MECSGAMPYCGIAGLQGHDSAAVVFLADTCAEIWFTVNSGDMNITPRIVVVLGWRSLLAALKCDRDAQSVVVRVLA